MTSEALLKSLNTTASICSKSRWVDHLAKEWLISHKAMGDQLIVIRLNLGRMVSIKDSSKRNLASKDAKS